MSGRRYRSVQDGEWVQPVRRGYMMRCCDCGLIHRLNFRTWFGRVQFQAFRDDRATAHTKERRMRHVQTSGTAPQLSDNTTRRPKPKKGKR